MPVYDFKCPQGCGYFDDIFVLLADHGTTTCPECGVLMDTVIGMVPIIGPMPSNPLVMKQLGRKFESGSEWRQYQRENPDCEMVSSDSSTWREHIDSVRHKAESRAKREGYRDFEDKKRKRKEEKVKRSGKLDNKIFIH
tara:strand:+ start:128 stop:544 length:417 start_codon:yes stop_codon:yes gene_type:complete